MIVSYLSTPDASTVINADQVDWIAPELIIGGRGQFLVSLDSEAIAYLTTVSDVAVDIVQTHQMRHLHKTQAVVVFNADAISTIESEVETARDQDPNDLPLAAAVVYLRQASKVFNPQTANFIATETCYGVDSDAAVLAAV